MPVNKFRSVEEMSAPRWYDRDDPALLEAIIAVWELGTKTRRKPLTPGVRRFRSYDELKRAGEVPTR